MYSQWPRRGRDAGSDGGIAGTEHGSVPGRLAAVWERVIVIRAEGVLGAYCGVKSDKTKLHSHRKARKATHHAENLSEVAPAISEMDLMLFRIERSPKQENL